MAIAWPGVALYGRALACSNRTTGRGPCPVWGTSDGNGTIMKKIAVTVAVLALGLAACGTKTENAVENDTAVENAVDADANAATNDAANAADNALDTAGNAIENAGNAVENAGDAVDNAAANTAN